MSATTSTQTQPADRQVHSGTRRAAGVPNLTSLWTLYVLTLREHLHGKRWIVMVALFLLPAAIALVALATAPKQLPSVGMEFLLAYMFIPQTILPLVALLYASGIIQDEQEEQTITYLLIRPIPKWAIYLVKLLATITTSVLLTALALAMTYASIYFGAKTHVGSLPLRYLQTTGIESLAVIAYCSLFGLMGLLTRRTLILGVIYTVIIEGVLANLPFSIRLATVIYYTRLIAYRTLDFVIVRPGGGTESIAATAWQLDVARDPDLLAHPQTGTCIAVLLIGSLVCAVLAAVICNRREFRVKVPEAT
jgi:ABC-2 type transport system permease protein